MPTDKAAGSGAAHDATIVVENNVGALEVALAEARAAERANRPYLAVHKLEEKVAKYRAHLAEAEAELGTAQEEVRRLEHELFKARDEADAEIAAARSAAKEN
jgi:hypothetical protein